MDISLAMYDRFKASVELDFITMMSHEYHGV